MKKSALFASLIILFSAVAVQSHAIGLSGDSFSRTISFEPGLEETHYYFIIPTTQKPTDVEVYVEDDTKDNTVTNLSKYFTISDPVFRKMTPGTYPTFSVKIKLPQKIEEPGTHKVHLGVRELPPAPGGIVVRTAIEALFYITVPYNGSYLRHDISAQSVNLGDDIPLTLSFVNSGNANISRLISHLTIFDSKNNSVAAAATDMMKLDSGEERSVVVKVPSANLFAGLYTVKSDITYDDKHATDSAAFELGQLNFEIINQTEEVTAGKINEITMDIKSDWAEDVMDVFAEVKLGNLDSVVSLPLDMSGFSRATLHAFVDTSTLQPGTYDMEITLHFAGKTVKKRVKVEVVKEGFILLPHGELSMNAMLFILILAIVLVINIVLFVILVKKKDAHEEEKP